MSQVSVGSALAAARAEAGLSLEELAQATMSRPALLRAMEADEFAVFGGAVYAKGHIRAYAHAVGIDPAPLVAQFELLVGNEAPNLVLATDTALGSPAHLLRERRKPPWLGVGLSAVALVAVLGVGSLAVGGSGGAPAPARAADPVVLPSPAATEPSAAGPPAAQAAATGDVNVTVQVKDMASWVGLYQPDSTVLAFQGVLDPGTRKVFTGGQSVKLRIGKPEAVEVFVNGRRVGSPGRAGQPTDVTYGPGGPASP